jgi:rubrerythrin
MKNLTTVEGVLDFAIAGEEESVQFYSDLADRVEKPWLGIRPVLQEFAREEMKHKEKLLAVKEGKLLVPAQQKVQDLQISDYLVDVKPSPNLDYQGVLILAMKKEKAAFMLYTHLAEITNEDNLRAIFLVLAQEEAKHKLRFEVEYDEHIRANN